jgi:hypothetical protein
VVIPACDWQMAAALRGENRTTGPLGVLRDAVMGIDRFCPLWVLSIAFISIPLMAAAGWLALERSQAICRSCRRTEQLRWLGQLVNSPKRTTFRR